MAQRAALFIDGRYTVQARMQAPAELFEFLHLNEDPHVQWLAEQLPSGSRVGFDARLHSLAWYQNANAVLTERGIELVRIERTPSICTGAIVPPRPRALSSSTARSWRASPARPSAKCWPAICASAGWMRCC
jgi:hypothetical protein